MERRARTVKRVLRLVSFGLYYCTRAFSRLLEWLEKYRFAACGRGVRIGRRGRFTYHNVYIGNNVFVGENASFTSAERRIVIGDNVMFGPSVAIIGGNHRFKDIVGKYMIEAKDINPQDHGDVIIEEDCWIGFGTIILKGVKIGKGSVIGAGSIVTRDIPQYSIYVGAPLLSLRRRWDLKTIELHERLISKRAC